MKFQKLNNISGWAIFAIATLTYIFTVEETASFWDCGEFIAVSFKLMVSHPPGAPFFMIIGRMFSFLALGDVERVAFWINMASVLSSGFTILFLFWTIVMFGRKMMGNKMLEELTPLQQWTLIISGAIGALAYTWSDTFWFSAVEAEVYAMSSLFTALVVWAIMKWDLIEDEARANRWIIFIAYMMGLSIGVHLLNLVTIPALGLIYYFKKYQVSRMGILATLAISGGIIILINNIIIPGLPSVASVFEVTFVNTFGLPFGSGALFFFILLLAAIVFGIYYTQKNGKVLANTFLLGLAFVLIGYSSYTVVVIRSNFDPPIDENNPEDVMSFVKFLKREQYGSRPLFHGQYFNSRPIDTKEGSAVYTKEENGYEIAERKLSYVYDKTTIFPRIYSTDPSHQQRYRQILGLSEGENPTFSDNIYYLFKHQLGHMYFRYFLWNFVGRESDIKDAGTLTPFDEFEKVPSSLAENKGRNNYFMLPLLLGLMGLFYQALIDKKNAAVIGMLFFLLGIALILYLNGPPTEPRERDYIYAGSFYAFSIWIGLAVIALFDFLGMFIKNQKLALAITTIFCVLTPGIMLAENWDDHNRRDRFFSVDSAKNFLASCAPNAILMTGGDNDTFPLWYVQEVEGFRTDIRAIVLSYSNTDWYISQMRQQMYESEPFPLTLTQANYKQGGLNDYLIYEDRGITSINVGSYLKLIKENNPNLSQSYGSTNIVPGKTFNIPVNREKVLSMGIIPEGLDSLVVDQMVFSLKGNALEKKDLLLLDLLYTNDWERPIYLNNTSRQQINLNLDPYLVQEGNAYRILPVRNPNPNMDLVDTEKMFNKMMRLNDDPGQNFHYRGLDDPGVYYNQDYRDFARNLRLTFNTLVEALLDEGKKDKARQALLYSLETVPDESIPYDVSTFATVGYLLEVEESELALDMANTYGDRIIEEIQYDIDRGYGPRSYNLQRNMTILAALQRTLLQYGQEDAAQKFETAYEENLRLLEPLLNR